MAVYKITNQATLKEVVLKASYWKIREVAVKKITDQIVLKEVALKDEDSDVRESALKNITDKAFLKEVALKDSSKPVRQAPVKNDQAFLKEFALNNPVKYNDMGNEEGAEYVNNMTATELMELILYGEDGKDAKDLTWLCSRLAAKMMIHKEGYDMKKSYVSDSENTDRQVIEKFFHTFSGASALSSYRAIKGFWDPRVAENAFNGVMLQFAQLPKNVRDVHKQLYDENYKKK